MEQGRDSCGGGAAEWIEYKLAFTCQGKDQPFRQPHRELAGMRGLFHMVALYIGDVPHILRVFSQGIAGGLAFFAPLKWRLPGYFEGDAHSVEIKDIAVAFGVP